MSNCVDRDCVCVSPLLLCCDSMCVDLIVCVVWCVLRWLLCSRLPLAILDLDGVDLLCIELVCL